MSYNILALNNISEKGLCLLPSAEYSISVEDNSPDAILLRSNNMHDYAVPKSLKAMGRAGAGVNNIPLDKMSDAGVVVFNAPGANSNAVKELVIASMLMACRNLIPGRDFAQNLEGTDEEIHKQVEAGKKNFGGFELPTRTLGVVGLGAIGVKIANAARLLGMRVVGFDPLISIENAWGLDSAVEKAKDLEQVLAESDFITFHVPLVDATKNIINADSLKMMKDNVIILNFARNGIVNDEAVCKGIESGKVYSYICDFPSNLLNGHDRVVTLPHLGASTREAEENCAIMVAEQVKDYLENGNIKNSVNLPNMEALRKGVARITIINRNVPDMLGQVSHILGNAHVNISQMINNSRGELAYSIVDVDSTVSQEVEMQLADIEGVLRLRVL
ncbi:MAG TPA: 3-phosphoglycerate dehydrogenase [Leucothrix mucor]|nr:3-phosphoglycerate dehydrogenase [Leucothrix mucor]